LTLPSKLLSDLCFTRSHCELSPFCHTLKSILLVQVLMRCLQRRAGQVQMATPTLCATIWAGPFPACPRSSLPTSGLPAKSRSLSVASWTFRQDSLSHDCISAPPHCLVCATSAFAQDHLDFDCMLVSVCHTEDKACSIQLQPLVCGPQSIYSTSVSNVAEFAPSLHQQPLHGF